MREIKFRIWCGTEDKYIKGGVLTQGGKYRRLDNKPECYTTEQFTGLKDSNGVEIYESDLVEYYTTFHESDSAVDLFGVDPQMDFDAGGEVHRKYTGVIKFYPSTGFILANVKIYKCFSEGEYAQDVEDSDWEYIGKQSTKIMSCTSERCRVIGNIHENPELLK